MSKYAVHHDAPLTRTTPASGGGEAQFDDIWVDHEHRVTTIVWDSNGPSVGSRPFTELFVVVEGTGRYEIDGEEIAFGPGDFLAWPPNTDATLTPDDHVRVVAFCYPFIRPD